MATAIPPEVLGYLADQKTLTLATASPEGAPHATTFMYVNDELDLYFWARPSSTTARHLELNPRVSVAIDEYVADWNKAKGIQASGECVHVSAGEEMAKAVSLFADKFPLPGSRASTANISFFKIVVSELNFIDKISGGEDEFGFDFHREPVVSSGTVSA